MNYDSLLFNNFFSNGGHFATITSDIVGYFTVRAPIRLPL